MTYGFERGNIYIYSKVCGAVNQFVQSNNKVYLGVIVTQCSEG